MPLFSHDYIVVNEELPLSSQGRGSTVAETPLLSIIIIFSFAVCSPNPYKPYGTVDKSLTISFSFSAHNFWNGGFGSDAEGRRKLPKGKFVKTNIVCVAIYIICLPCILNLMVNI